MLLTDQQGVYVCACVCVGMHVSIKCLYIHSTDEESCFWLDGNKDNFPSFCFLIVFIFFSKRKYQYKLLILIFFCFKRYPTPL